MTHLYICVNQSSCIPSGLVEAANAKLRLGVQLHAAPTNLRD